jgi:hypothetical protein
MMNGPGKSDRPTVPEKSPNKVGRPAAEGGREGRGLAKGNMPQQNASRTPSWKEAPSALEQVRQAAKKDKQLRFTALLHHIYNLETLLAICGIFSEQIKKSLLMPFSRWVFKLLHLPFKEDGSTTPAAKRGMSRS